MGDKLRGVPIGKLYRDVGLLVNEAGIFMIDAMANVDLKKMFSALHKSIPKGSIMLCSSPQMVNPFYKKFTDLEAMLVKNVDDETDCNIESIDRVFPHVFRKMMRERHTHMYLELWSLVGIEPEDNLMYQGIRHMLWLEDIEDEEMFPSLNQYNCNYCAFDALNFTEVMTCHPQENSWVIRTNFRETHDPEWGLGAEWTETIICPRCGHISTWGTGYP